MGLLPIGVSAKTCVVVSYWRGRSPASLHRLLRQMMRVDAGADFDLLIVCNGGDQKPLVLPRSFDPLKPRILNRDNAGFNIGAWDAGWRSTTSHQFYLFLQDDCFLRRRGWVSDFEFRMARDLGLGLLGESIMWDRASWPYVRDATDRDLGVDWWKGETMNPIDFYQAFLKQQRIPSEVDASHLQTLTLFASRKALQDIGGLLIPPAGATKLEAIACEVALSRLVESKGYRIAKVRDDSFHYIGHPQWTRFGLVKMKWKRSLLRFLRSHGLDPRRQKRPTAPSIQARIAPPK